MVTLTILPDHLNLYVLCKKAYYPTDVSLQMYLKLSLNCYKFLMFLAEKYKIHLLEISVLFETFHAF